MERGRPAEGITLAHLREIRDWGQKKLAAEAGLEPDTISFYERRRCSQEQLHRLGVLMGFTADYIDRQLALVQEGRALLVRSGNPTRDEAAAREMQDIAAQEGRRYEEFLRVSLHRYDQAADALLERRAAPRLLRRLRRHPERRWRALIETDEEFWSWGLVELLCEESVEAALSDTGRAEQLAELTLLIARHLPGSEVRRARTEGYGWAFVGNARRVHGLLRQAEEAFMRHDALFSQSDLSDPPLDLSRPLDLKASLRLAQRRLSEALDLLGYASKTASTDHALGRILVIRAKTLEEMDDYPGAIAALRNATPHVERADDPRLLLTLRFNLLEYECQTGPPIDVPDRFAEVRELAGRLQNALDLVRLCWLEGRLSLSAGQRAEAEKSFREVASDLASRGMYYDTALVLLELAILLLEDGRILEVKELASSMNVIFHSEGVHREAIAALSLLYEAVQQERATAEMARHVLTFLRRARNNQELRFEPLGVEEAPSPEGRNRGRERE